MYLVMFRFNFVRKGFLGVAIFVSLLNFSFAQYNNEIYLTNLSSEPLDSQRLFLHIDNSNFLSNNEFPGNFVNGYTLIGFNLTPKLVYQPSGKIRLKAGAHFLHYYGRENFSSAIPVFSLQYMPTPSFYMIVGSLHGALNHKLIEPLFEFERFFTNKQESGLQILFNTPFIYSDTWLNWEKFILEGDPFQEEFVVGSSNTISLSKPGSLIRMQVPIQLLASHKGGEINSVDLSVQTIINSATGFSITGLFKDSGFRSVEINSFLLTYNDLSRAKEFPYTKGMASYTNLIAQWKGLTFGIGYWYGDQFISNRGRPLFQSVSLKDPLYFEKARQMITSKFIFTKNVGREVNIGVRLESYYDLKNRNLDYTFGLQIIYRQNFFLKKID
jgi:hypothetical protein